MRQYLIPANSKKSQLILGFFRNIDLIIFISGVILTFIMLMVFKNPSGTEAIIILIPILTAAFLVMPVPYYHNMLQLLTNIIMFYTNRRHYYWKGWCIRDEERF